MNFKKLTKKEKQLVLEVMWQIQNIVNSNNKITFKKYVRYTSFDYDSEACERQFKNLLEHIESFKNNSSKYLQLRKLLSERF